MRYIYVPLLALVFTLSLGVSSVNAQSDAAVEASSNAALQAQISELLAQINVLKAQLAAQEEKTTTLGQEISKLRLEARLAKGSQGEGVRTLQKLLATDPALYPEGLVTGVFGPLTENAVKRFQAKLKLEQAGVVGPQTLAKINEILSAAGVSGDIPSDFLGSRIKIEVEVKDGKHELKIEVKCNSSGTGNLCKDDDDDEDEDEDEDENELEIEVEIEEGKAHVDVEQGDDEFRFVLNTTEHSAIISELSNRLGLTESDIEAVIEFEDEDEDEGEEDDMDDSGEDGIDEDDD